MHPLDCPGWEYENHPNRGEVPRSIARVVSDLALGKLDTRQTALDSRRCHERIFESVVPQNCEYYAGHYRGEPFRCLRFYSVGVQGDPRVGARAEAVAYLMEELRALMSTAITALDQDPVFAEKEKLRYIVALACQVFVEFLTIHPYANGNGHAGRLIVWSILGRYGYWPKRWTIDPRPQNPPYLQLISNYRNGLKEPLEMYVLQMVLQ